ncbi:hypothetical protein BHM03_00055245 [Ensete ventricosum]|nr:hypothetical protein BHM03_00055245 [Ensete ventricosum]
MCRTKQNQKVGNFFNLFSMVRHFVPCRRIELISVWYTDIKGYTQAYSSETSPRSFSPHRETFHFPTWGDFFSLRSPKILPAKHQEAHGRWIEIERAMPDLQVLPLLLLFPLTDTARNQPAMVKIDCYRPIVADDDRNCYRPISHGNDAETTSTGGTAR